MPTGEPVPDLTGNLEVDAWEQRHRYLSREDIDTYFDEDFDTEELPEEVKRLEQLDEEDEDGEDGDGQDGPTASKRISDGFGRMTSSVVNVVKYGKGNNKQKKRERRRKMMMMINKKKKDEQE